VIDVRIHPRRVAAVGLLALTGAALSPVVADAKPKPPGEEGATHGRTSCSILTPGIAPGVITTAGRYTITPSGNGTLVCHGQVPQGPAHALVVKGLRCPTPAGVTNKSHTVVTPSGRVTLTCHFKARGD
jgi:hypothetical protein